MSKRVTVSEDTKDVLESIVEQADSYTYAKDALQDITDAIEDIDLREHPDYDNRVEVLVDGAHTDGAKAGIRPVNYDPDEDIDGWLESDTVRVIVSKPGAMLNPDHVNSASKPRDRVDKRKMIAALVRYKYRDSGRAHIERIYDLVNEQFGASETIREYVPEVKQHHFWEDPSMDRIVITDPERAGVSVQSRIDALREDIKTPDGDEYYVTEGKRRRFNDLIRDVQKLEPFVDRGEPVEMAIKKWNGLVEDVRAGAKASSADVSPELEKSLVTIDV